MNEELPSYVIKGTTQEPNNSLYGKLTIAEGAVALASKCLKRI